MKEDEDDGSEFGKEIRRRRCAKGWQQDELGRRVSAVSRTVGRWERGERLPKPYNIIGLKRELGFTDSEIQAAFGVQLTAPSPHATEYSALSFGRASEKLGSIEAVADAMERVESEFPVPHDDEEYGTDEQWLDLMKVSPESGGLITVNDHDVVGYWYCLAVRDDTYEAILRGQNVNKTISSANLEILMIPGTYKMYFVDLFLKTSHLNVTTKQLIVHDFLAFLRQAAIAKIFFDRIAANITGGAIKNLCQGLGFRKVTDHSVHRYVDQNGALVKAEIFELDVTTGAKRLFSLDEDLYKLYAAQGLVSW